MGPQIIAAGIMAHNEDKVIEMCIDSLLLQDLGEEYVLEIFVVANACTDRTCDVVSRRYGGLRNLHLIAVKEKGKCHAVQIFKERIRSWNESESKQDRRIDKLLFLDADVYLNTKDAIYLMGKTLDNRSDLSAVLPAGIPNLTNTASVLISRLYEAKTNLVFAVKGTSWSGQCYMIRNGIAQMIDIPNYIMSDDWYISERLRSGYVRDYNIRYSYSVPPNMGAEINRIFRHSLTKAQMSTCFFGRCMFQKPVVEGMAPVEKSSYDRGALLRAWRTIRWDHKLLLLLFYLIGKVGDIRAKVLLRKYGAQNVKLPIEQWQTIR